jgi:hypothetical protein
MPLGGMLELCKTTFDLLQIVDPKIEPHRVGERATQSDWMP